jgi:hypothetical protein
MIYSALQSLTLKLNDFIKIRYGTNEDLAELSNILEQDGSLTLKETNKLIVSLINLEREPLLNGFPRSYDKGGTTHRVSAPPAFINLFVIFIALSSGKHYPNALKLLSTVVEFFQVNFSIDHQNTPWLSNNIEKLTFEIVNIDIQTLSQLWGALGCKYMPSVVYKVRMLTIDPEEVQSEIPAILKTQPNLSQHP